MAKELGRPSFFAPIFAWFRQGGKEFAQALPATRESIQPVNEPGTLGNPTQAELTAESGALREKKNILDRYDSRSIDRDDRGIDIDR